MASSIAPAGSNASRADGDGAAVVQHCCKHKHTSTNTLHTTQQQEKDLIRLKREAKAAKGFYVEPEAKLAFVIRIRGLNKIHPKVRALLMMWRE